MITMDEHITDPAGANAYLQKFFRKTDLCNEVAHQVLATLIVYGEPLWVVRQ